MEQERIEELLKKKGIGPLGSKSLSADEVKLVRDLFIHSKVSLTTKATMLTALLMLEANPDETKLINEIKADPKSKLPAELVNFIESDRKNPFQNLVNKTINKENLTTQEASTAMDFFFNTEEPAFLKASFLEAQRLKRETFVENQAFLHALWNKARRITIDQKPVIHICDSFDGSNRTRNYVVFVAALLAAAGYNCIVSGIDSVAPKQGVTAHQILQEGGKKPLLSMQEASAELQNIGWSYIDQAVFMPELYAFKNMRKEMVKRPFLATFEKLLQPIRSATENYIVTGYTHPHYREELVKQLKEHKQCSKAIILKGMEGNTHLSLSKESVCVQLDGEIISDSMVSPQHYTLTGMEEKQDKNITAQTSLEEGLAAFKGVKNYARESILYLAAVILDRFKLQPASVVDKLSNLIDDGFAIQKFNEKA